MADRPGGSDSAACCGGVGIPHLSSRHHLATLGLPRMAIRTVDVPRQPRVQTLAVTGGQLEDEIISGQDENVTRRVENRGTDFAGLQVFLHQLFCFRRQRAVEEFGEVIPDVFAF